MNNELNIELLAEKSVRGILEVAERAALEDWLSADPLNRKEFEELRAILQLTEDGLDAVDPETDSNWGALERMIASENQATSRKRVLGGRRAWAIAASVVLLAVVGMYFLSQSTVSGAGGKQLVYAAESTAAEFSLPDQSQVRLQPGSKLTLAANFNEADRQMELEGVAVFKVTRDEQKPFVVKAGETMTKVLGTEFELNTLAEENAVKLHVLSGKVSFSGEKSTSPAILTAHMKGHYDHKSGEIKLEQGSPTASKDSPRSLVVKDQSLSEVLPEIEALFGIKMEIPSNLQETRLTATFESGAEQDMIAALELILDGKFEKKDANYTFFPRR